MIYCDYIAETINVSLKENVNDKSTYISEVGGVNLDLHPTEGYYVSPKKTMSVTDKNGKKYIVTIEEEWEY